MYVKIVLFVCGLLAINRGKCEVKISSHKFPDGFLFGVATSAYQIEGGHDIEGKGPNIFDHFTKTRPDAFHNGSSGDIACDYFHNWQEDIKLLKNLGVNFYRFSISWSRILPEGHTGNVNKEGLRFYNDIINKLIENKIEPMVTIFHWDLPLPLLQLGGWTNPYIADYLQDYAKILFIYFGDRVKYWITMNTFNCHGYGDSLFPPFINQPGIANYLCNHVVLLAHAKVYHLYDNEFRQLQHGKVGITIDGRWFEPASNSQVDIEATERARQFLIGLTANPILHPDGDYPKIVRDHVDDSSQREGFLTSRLPKFTTEEKEYVQGTFDFIGLNVYTTFLAKNAPEDLFDQRSIYKDAKLRLYQSEEWPRSNTNWLRVVPSTMRNVLKWFKDNYDDPDVFVTENGYSDQGQIDDVERIEYYQGYLSSLLDAIHEDRVNVKGYSAWSLLDNFEWTSGYSEKFGLVHVNFDDPKRKRTPKYSSKWYRKVIKEKRVVRLEEVGEISKNTLKGEL